VASEPGNERHMDKIMDDITVKAMDKLSGNMELTGME